MLLLQSQHMDFFLESAICTKFQQSHMHFLCFTTNKIKFVAIFKKFLTEQDIDKGRVMQSKNTRKYHSTSQKEMVNYDGEL